MGGRTGEGKGLQKTVPNNTKGTKVKSPIVFTTSSPKKCKTKRNKQTQNPLGSHKFQWKLLFSDRQSKETYLNLSSSETSRDDFPL